MRARRFTLPCRCFRLEMLSNESYLILQIVGPQNSKHFLVGECKDKTETYIQYCRKPLVSGVHFDNSIKYFRRISLVAPRNKKKGIRTRMILARRTIQRHRGKSLLKGWFTEDATVCHNLPGRKGLQTCQAMK